MRLRNKIFLYFMSSFSLYGCHEHIGEELIVGSYYLDVVDIPEDMNLSYKLEDGNYVGVVAETVFAVGFNEKYIIAKQHPSNNREIINYYIIPVYSEKTLSPEKGVVGPITLKQFIEKRKELNIPDALTFTKVMKDLE